MGGGADFTFNEGKQSQYDRQNVKYLFINTKF